MSPPYMGYSRTLNESKEKGFFKFEVVADKPTLILDSTHKLSITSAWIENTWEGQVLVFGKTPPHKNNDSYQLIVNLNIIGSAHNPYYYFFRSHDLDTFNHIYCHRIDTIVVPIYRELTDELPDKKDRVAFDSIIFIKK